MTEDQARTTEASREDMSDAADTDRHALPLSLSGALVALGATALMLVTYWDAIFKTYARLDDYSYLYYARTGELDVLAQVWLNGGRPIPALISAQLLPAIESIDNLAILRLLGALSLTLGAAALGAVVLVVSRRRTVLDVVLGIGVALVALTTTAAPSSITWAIMVGQLPSVFLATSGGLLAVFARARWHFALSGLLIAGATFAYQPTTPVAFFVAAFASATLWAQGRHGSWWRPFSAGVMVVATMAVNYAFVVLRGSPALDRLSGPTFSERVRWFTTEFVPRTVDLTVPWSLEGAAFSAALAAVLLLMPLTLGRRYVVLPLAVLVSWACAALVVFPGELWASHRLISGAQLVFWVGAAACAAVAISGLSNRHLASGMALLTFAAVGVAYSMYVSHERANEYFADPNVVDWQAMQCAIQEARPLDERPVIELNDYGESTSPVLSYDEYGAIASATSWATAFAAWMALDSVNGRPPPSLDVADIVLAPPAQSTTPGAIMVDPSSCAAPPD